MTGNHWTNMFEPQGRGSERAAAAPPPPSPTLREEPEEDVLADPTDYRPWVLQRGRSRPAMMLHLRRFETRSAMWMGWAVSYPHLAAVEYVGDRMVSLDFGMRQFVVQGQGLDQLIAPLQQGIVLALYEHSASVWARPPGGPIISSIRRLGVPDTAGASDA